MPIKYDSDRDLPTNSGLYWNMGRIYYVISHGGKVFKGSTGTDEVQAAIAFRKNVQAEIVKGERQAGTNRVVRIGELLDDLITRLEIKDREKGEYGGDTAYKTKCSVEKHVRPFFGKIKAVKLDTDHITTYKKKRIEEYVKAGKPEGSWVVAINRELGYLRTAMRDGMKTKKVSASNIPHFPIAIDIKAEQLRRRKEIITPEQFKLLMQHAADHLKPALPLLTYCGLRAKEVKFVRRSQVDWANMVISLRDGETKEGDGRHIPILDVAVVPLREWIAYTEETFPECRWLFHFNGNQVHSWNTAWNAALRRAGLRVVRKDPETGEVVRNDKGKMMWSNLVRFHDTRRTAITTHDEAGVQEVDSEGTAGHKTVQVHRGYNQSKKAAERTRKAMNAHLNNGVKELQPEPQQEVEAEAKEPKIDIKAATIQAMTLLEKGLLTPEMYAATIASLSSK